MQKIITFVSNLITMKKATKKEIVEKSQEMYQKYNELLWYARVKPENFNVPIIKEKMEEIMSKHFDDVKELETDRTNWVHGFNSGCNAAFVFILHMVDIGVEQAEEEFPFLDT